MRLGKCFIWLVGDLSLRRVVATRWVKSVSLLLVNITTNMIRSDVQRPDAKRRYIQEKKKQFAGAAFKQQDYLHRLNFYDVPPITEISLEDFEQWAIDRLRSEYPAPFLLVYQR